MRTQRPATRALSARHILLPVLSPKRVAPLRVTPSGPGGSGRNARFRSHRRLRVLLRKSLRAFSVPPSLLGLPLPHVSSRVAVAPPQLLVFVCARPGGFPPQLPRSPSPAHHGGHVEPAGGPLGWDWGWGWDWEGGALGFAAPRWETSAPGGEAAAEAGEPQACLPSLPLPPSSPHTGTPGRLTSFPSLPSLPSEQPCKVGRASALSSQVSPPPGHRRVEGEGPPSGFSSWFVGCIMTGLAGLIFLNAFKRWPSPFKQAGVLRKGSSLPDFI